MNKWWAMLAVMLMSVEVGVLPGQVVYTVIPAVPPQTSVAQPTNHGVAARVTLVVKDSTVAYVVRTLTQAAHLQLVYDTDNPLMAKRINVRIMDTNVMDAIAITLKGTGLVAKLASDGVTIVVRPQSGSADAEHARVASGTVAGRVTDSASGQGLSGAQVRVEGVKELSTVTSDSGNFTLHNVPVGDQVIIVRLFGYKPAQRTVTVADSGRVSVRIVMVPVPTVLSGVVTTATGLQKRIEVGNDITVLNADSIMQVAPVSNLTQMLETRVPGMIVQHTSGIPGAPSRIRLRGESSLLMSDDPIFIVDGIRVYADQSGSRAITTSSGSAISSGGGSGISGGAGQGGIGGTRQYSGPSAIDQIDPNSIDKIEVLKGPSATAIYGSDAANGVIIVTTKHGRAGPTHWTLTLGYDRTTLPGDWPINWYNWGHSNLSTINGQGNNSIQCSILSINVGPYGCVRDSLVAYQALNDPRLSPLGIGGNDNASFTVSGGNGTLSYSVTGSASNNAGYLHLPSAVAQLFDSVHGFAAPTWMKNPDVYANYGGSSSLTAQIGNAGATITLNSQLFHSDQQQSSLQSILGLLQYSYIGSGAVAAQALVNNFPNFFERAQLNTMTFNNSLSLTNWAPWHWLPIQATAGLSVSNTDNNALMPRDYAFSGFDTIGRYAITRGSNVTQSLMAGTNLLGSRLVSTAIGINVYASQNTNFGASTIGLPIGVTAPTSFLYTNSGPSNSQFNSATYGWYVQPTLNLNSRFFASPGFRLDGGSASGIHSGVSGGALSLFPKLDLSYVAVNRPPSDPMWGMITLLRPRIAFGVAGVQPGPAMKLRLLNPSLNLPIDTTGTATPVSLLYYQTLGNTQLHPERSREVEGGADIQFWNNRLSLILTGYHKMRYDAIENISAAPSTSTNDGNNNFYFANIGTIRNTGLEATVSALLIDSRVMQWSINGNVSHNDNIFVSSNFGGSPVFANAFQSGIIVQSVPGFPVNGLWAKPILGFGDSNGDGMIEPNEVRLGDSLAYIGASLPNYELTLNTTLSFFNNRLSVSTSIDYQNGLTQTNGSTGRSANDLLFNDPSITLSREAAIAAQFAIPNTLIGMAQTVNTLRWTSLSVNYLVPPNVSHLFRVPSLSLALQGSNLGLHTNYRGKDPNVNAFSGGNTTQDAGQLPLPRLWRVSVRIGN